MVLTKSRLAAKPLSRKHTPPFRSIASPCATVESYLQSARRTVWNGDFGKLCLDDGTLGGIVIYKNEGVSSDIQCLGDFKEILVLRRPVSLETGNVFQAK